MSLPSLPADPCLTAEMNRQLSLSLASALAAESRGSQVNTAKLRSVSQLDSYDAFRSMVAGAHLKGINLAQQPLDGIVAASGRAAKRETGGGAEDGTADSRRSAAQLAAPGRREEELSRRRGEELLWETRRQRAQQRPLNGRCTDAAAAQSATAHRLPLIACSACVLRRVHAAAYELKRDWKRLGTDPERAAEERFSYLMLLDAPSLPSVMKGGVGLEALGEMLQAINARRRSQQQQQSAFDSQARAVFRLLSSLSTVARFDLSLAFLSQQQRQDARDICDWLMTVAQAEQQHSNSEEEESGSGLSHAAHQTEEKEQMMSACPPSRSPASLTSSAPAAEAAFDCDGVQLLIRRYRLQTD